MIPAKASAQPDRNKDFMAFTLRFPSLCSPEGIRGARQRSVLCGDLKLRLCFRRLQVKNRGEPMAGVAGWVGGDLFGCAYGDDLAAAAAAFGAHVDDPVGGFDDVEIVLDDEKGAAAFDEFAEGGEEFGYVVEVEAGGGLVEDVEGSAAGFGCRVVCGASGDGAGGGEMRGEFDALGFAAGECGGRLAQADVAWAYLVEDVEL